MIVSIPSRAELIYFDTVADKEIKHVSLDFKPAAMALRGKNLFVAQKGASLLHVPCVGENTIIGLDKGCALEMVQAGDILTDYDKLIDRQLERAAISCIAGFAKILPDASRVLQAGE